MNLYVDGELASEEILEFEKHLVECEACLAEYYEVRQAVDTIRGAHPLYDIPASSLERVKGLVDSHRRTRRLQRSAAAVAAAVVVCFVVVWLLSGRSAGNPEFVVFAAETHLRYAREAMPLDIVSPEPTVISQWLGARLPFHLELPDYPVEPSQKRYHLVGARLLQFANDDVGYLAYEMGPRPISLLMASSTATRPGGGEVYRSGTLAFHFAYEKGLRLISWTDAGINYCLVSELNARGADSCVICHGTAEERHRLEGLPPR
jgi:anti-sigma factor RsiW